MQHLKHWARNGKHHRANGQQKWSVTPTHPPKEQKTTLTATPIDHERHNHDVNKNEIWAENHTEKNGTVVGFRNKPFFGLQKVHLQSSPATEWCHWSTPNYFSHEVASQAALPCYNGDELWLLSSRFVMSGWKTGSLRVNS